MNDSLVLLLLLLITFSYSLKIYKTPTKSNEELIACVFITDRRGDVGNTWRVTPGGDQECLQHPHQGRNNADIIHHVCRGEFERIMCKVIL